MEKPSRQIYQKQLKKQDEEYILENRSFSSNESYSDQNIQNEHEESLINKMKSKPSPLDQSEGYGWLKDDQSDNQLEQDDENEQEEDLQTDDNQGHFQRRRQSGRKIRVTITRQKLNMMNQVFSEYARDIENGKYPKRNLKQIGSSLSLGYSTILHKYREFRMNKVVKGGALIASLQKKRKYKKSLEIEEMISEALAEQPFYTAVELVEYIIQRWGKNYSRSIISRHLGQMGYSYKNLKSSPIQKNHPKYQQNRRLYSDVISSRFTVNTQNYLYIDELACSFNAFQKRRFKISMQASCDDEQNYASLIIGATCQGVVRYEIKQGFYNSQQFARFLGCCAKKMNAQMGRKCVVERIVLVTDINKIHYDPFTAIKRELVVKPVVEQYQMQRLYLPPSSPHFNPLEHLFTNLKAKLYKKDIRSVFDLKKEIEKEMIEISREPVEVYFSQVAKCVSDSKGEGSLEIGQMRSSGEEISTEEE